MNTTTELPFSDPAKHQAAVETLLLAKQILGGLKVPFWLSHGTLLGAIRDNNFIAHDSDIDLGIWDDCGSHIRIYIAFTAAGFRLAHEYGQHGLGHQYSFWSPQGVYTDLFFYASGHLYSYCTIWKSPTEPRQQFFPPAGKFKMIEFQSGEYRVPHHAKAWLEANYGPDWRTPIAPVERGGTWHWADSPMNYEAAK